MNQTKCGKHKLWSDLICFYLSAPSAGKDWNEVDKQRYTRIDEAQDWEHKSRLVIHERILQKVEYVKTQQNILKEEIQYKNE